MSNLKPLQEPCPETTVNGVSKKRWGYSGKILYQDDVDRLTAKGVDWELDIMPDGRLKFPKYRQKRLRNRDAALKAANDNPKHCGNKEFQERRWQEYLKLPEPRPDYFEWASQYSRREQFDALERILFNSRRDSDRIKASATMLEFSKSKPKQVVEQINNVQEEEIPLDKLLDTVLEAKGIDPLMFRKFVEAQAQEKPAN